MRYIAGVDEAGRGALAGPVVAAAVMLCSSLSSSLFKDSKQLSAKKRLELFRLLMDSQSIIGIGMATHRCIGKMNIFWATLQAMRKSVRKLAVTPQHVLIDGNRVPPDMTVPACAIVKGDQREPVISAASIVAKVIRDRVMCSYSLRYPKYGFSAHKGYGTRQHYHALLELGTSPIHRPGFNMGFHV